MATWSEFHTPSAKQGNEKKNSQTLNLFVKMEEILDRLPLTFWLRVCFYPINVSWIRYDT